MKSLLLGVVGALALIGAAQAADIKFALIPKGMDNPVFRSLARRLHGRGQEARRHLHLQRPGDA